MGEIGFWIFSQFKPRPSPVNTAMPPYLWYHLLALTPNNVLLQTFSETFAGPLAAPQPLLDFGPRLTVWLPTKFKLLFFFSAPMPLRWKISHVSNGNGNVKKFVNTLNIFIFYFIFLVVAQKIKFYSTYFEDPVK